MMRFARPLPWLALAPLLWTACGQQGGDVGSTTQAAEIPCEVGEVLEKKCASCHSETPKYGAPMPLTAYANTQDPAKSDPSKTVWQLMQERVHSATRPMPPSGKLTDAELAALDSWFASQAPAKSDTADSCGGRLDQQVDGGVASDGSTTRPPVGPVATELPCTPTHRIVAHAPGDREAPFHVGPEVDDLYQCFVFKSPFKTGDQATAFAPIIDDERVVHHWILYSTKTPQTEGAVRCRMPFDNVFVMGWAPGAGVQVLPDNVGLELPGEDSWLMLQIHYYNVPGYTDADDRSGVELCLAEERREHTAGVVSLGSIGFSVPPRSTGTEVQGRCSTSTMGLTEPIHILSSFPHMHKYGTKFLTQIQRASGGREDLVRLDRWDFADQSNYTFEQPIEVRPGDGLYTTCTYDNPNDSPVQFGEGSDDEMCFNFITVYPVPTVPLPMRACIF